MKHKIILILLAMLLILNTNIVNGSSDDEYTFKLIIAEYKELRCNLTTDNKEKSYRFKEATRKEVTKEFTEKINLSCDGTAKELYLYVIVNVLKVKNILYLNVVYMMI